MSTKITFLPNKLTHIVSSKTLLAIIPVFITTIVPVNNQNSGDLITSMSSISSSTIVPGKRNRTTTVKMHSVKHTINPGFRHLYLSVNTPTVGLINMSGSVSKVKIKPAMNAEYPRCLIIVDKKHTIGALPRWQTNT